MLTSKIRPDGNSSGSFQPEWFNGSTPLHEASRYGHTTLVELLVDHRADIDSLDG